MKITTYLVRFDRTLADDWEIAKAKFPTDMQIDALRHQFWGELLQHKGLKPLEHTLQHVTPRHGYDYAYLVQFTVDADLKFQSFRQMLQSCYDDLGMSGVFDILQPQPEADLPTVKEVQAWQTSDLVLHEKASDARKHQEYLNLLHELERLVAASDQVMSKDTEAFVEILTRMVPNLKPVLMRYSNETLEHLYDAYKALRNR